MGRGLRPAIREAFDKVAVDAPVTRMLRQHWKARGKVIELVKVHSLNAERVSPWRTGERWHGPLRMWQRARGRVSNRHAMLLRHPGARQIRRQPPHRSLK